MNKFPSIGVSIVTFSCNKYSSPSFIVISCWVSLIGFTCSADVVSLLTSFSALTIGANNEISNNVIKEIILRPTNTLINAKLNMGILLIVRNVIYKIVIKISKIV